MFSGSCVFSRSRSPSISNRSGNDTRIRELLEVSEAASTLRWIWTALVIFVAIGLGARFRPGILAVTGTSGLLLIPYLMLFKPTL